MENWIAMNGWPHEKSFFTEIVLQNYVDFILDFSVDNPNNIIRVAWNSAISLYHFREHMNLVPTFDKVGGKCIEYNILRDLVISIKHRSVKAPKSGMTGVTFQFMPYIVFGPGSVLDGPTGSGITLPIPGVKLPLEDVLDAVFDYWISELNSLWGTSMTRDGLVAIARRNRGL